ncbi:hypothetical protein [Streptomyces sp. NPDC000410]|uniref:hypothetical protein n=1 Tax=Streptomyces sp. NPDC000410 TaxID=3154254 RepID=UPI00331A7070
MFPYEFHKEHQAELIRRADTERLARQVRRARRAERRSAENGPEGRVSIRSRFERAA